MCMHMYASHQARVRFCFSTGSVTITATSVADTTQSASTIVRITPNPITYVCAVQSTTPTGEVIAVTISNFNPGQSITVSCPVTHP
jgi:hypothetical protein